MEKIKELPKSIINKVRKNPDKSGLAFKKYGKSPNIQDYSDREITEMIHGIYKDFQIILVDGDYFIDLNDVIETICVLDDVTYYKKPTEKDFTNNAHNNIKNIRTFYVKDYILVTKNEVSKNTKHKITNLLHKIGEIRQGRGIHYNQFSYPNDYKTLQSFRQGYFPKDLYHPIKRYINGLFFNDDYRISDFKVESKIRFEVGYQN